MAENFMEISKEDIEIVENALKVNSDYKPTICRQCGK